ncbi:MAG: BrnT family toxin [Allosphingosinicella sp.]
MKIEFDPEKREDILCRRGLDLATVGELIGGDCLTEADDRFDYGEDRWISVGPLGSDIVVCVWTDRGDNVVRAITMWKARAREQEKYFKWREGA